MASRQVPKTILVTGANSYIGHEIALAFVRAGYKTYGLVRNPSFISTLASEEIIPLLGSPVSPDFLPSFEEKQIFDYFPHYNEVVSLLHTLAKSTLEKKGTKPLLFTSGCKDYGISPHLATSPDLAPHTEDSPLDPPPFAIDRANGTKKIFENADVFDVVVLRPTNVYGGNSNYYGLFFVAEEEGRENGVWEVDEEPRTVLHAMHVDDCGEAYVALAECGDRRGVSGQCLISLLELGKEYGIEGGVTYVEGEEGRKGPGENRDRMLMRFTSRLGARS
ncbi:hypothetical protein BKA61DRAFT_650814 [Leptodontidium sp. MPI-SDFR-AT-0119]|nr:hypothetical protein BKA61DRAFT_650814 [Leptodontidium sp. MPI-SDFR-AT-0119]